MNQPRDSSGEKQARWWRSPGVVYFLAAGQPHTAIKIGATTRATLLDRMKKTQAHNHEPIELLGLIRFNDSEFPTRDAEDHERLLLQRFSHLCRFKPGTRGAEWLSISRELLDLIRTTIPPEPLGVPRFVCTLLNNDVLAP